MTLTSSSAWSAVNCSPTPSPFGSRSASLQRRRYPPKVHDLQTKAGILFGRAFFPPPALAERLLVQAHVRLRVRVESPGAKPVWPGSRKVARLPPRVDQPLPTVAKLASAGHPTVAPVFGIWDRPTARRRSVAISSAGPARRSVPQKPAVSGTASEPQRKLQLKSSAHRVSALSKRALTSPTREGRIGHTRRRRWRPQTAVGTRRPRRNAAGLAVRLRRVVADRRSARRAAVVAKPVGRVLTLAGRLVCKGLYADVGERRCGEATLSGRRVSLLVSRGGSREIVVARIDVTRQRGPR